MRKYADEFKQLAVNKVFDGQAVASIAKELGVDESSIHQWRRERLKNGTPNAAPTGAQERELGELKKRLREVEMECDSLKKAARIFGRGS